MPGIKITDKDRQRIDEKFICTLCKMLLYLPMQTTCGHLMCQTCIENLLKSSCPRCPEDGERLSKEKVFPDVFTKRELNGLHLYCAIPGCSCCTTYEKLKDHSQVCEHAVIECVHSQCPVKFQRSYLGEHLKSECEYRNVKCRYCQEDVAFASMEEHVKSICENAPVTCKYCKENILRKDLERHEKNDCNEVPVTCDYRAIGCNQTLKRKELRQHLNDELMHHAQLLLQYVLAFVSQLGNYIPRSELAEEFIMIVGKLTGLERRIETLEASGRRDAQTRNEVSEIKKLVRDLTAEWSNLRERNTSLERQFRDKMSIMTPPQCREDVKLHKDMPWLQAIHSYNGELLWKIEGYQRKRRDAIKRVKTALYSPPFYTAQFGYKMCAKIYMNGDGSGKGSHLSLFFVVMRGDYDALQTWPFQKKITMMLLDQGNGDHMIDAFHSDPYCSSFQRPKSDMNIASGSPLFMPLDSLKNRQFVKDDVMFIKVIVD